jgi:hypothetical protein
VVLFLHRFYGGPTAGAKKKYRCTKTLCGLAGEIPIRVRPGDWTAAVRQSLSRTIGIQYLGIGQKQPRLRTQLFCPLPSTEFLCHLFVMLDFGLEPARLGAKDWYFGYTSESQSCTLGLFYIQQYSSTRVLKKYV